MSLFHAKIEGVPQFVSYFDALLRALHRLGGTAQRKDVFKDIAEHQGITEEEYALTTKDGVSKFEVGVSWARFYLIKSGWMYAPKRGVWALTDKGKEKTALTSEEAIAIFQGVQTKFKGHEEDVAVPEDVQPDGTQYWFVGAIWDDVDQMPRFVQAGIWQNGYEDKFIDLVRTINPGDRIAIKSSLSRKHGLPFENKGLTVSGMRIKAIGTVTRNHGDGRTVDVEWEPLDTPKEWYFYTYRSTITRAKVEDEELARRLVRFSFEKAEQDYDFFMRQPYWRERFLSADASALQQVNSDDNEELLDEEEHAPVISAYGIADILAEGCFVPDAELHSILRRWESKKNLILQGPPGTGKTWLAKRLAKALIGQQQVSDEQLRTVQFHPTLSYEDFVRGYRPNGDGRLSLTDGLFLQVVEAARYKPDTVHVLIIEEINRGNPAQVFGELLTLIENTKRNSDSAMELAYPRQAGEKVFVPENLYVIGTMNVADRSLALVDLALRRRFAFVNLVPSLNEAWQQWCAGKGLDESSIAHIQTRMQALNDEIATDRALGAQFQIGHSYVTPHEPVHDAQAWFAEVVQSEIGPLLHEYWFDTPERADEAIAQLLKAA